MLRWSLVPENSLLRRESISHPPANAHTFRPFGINQRNAVFVYHVHHTLKAFHLVWIIFQIRATSKRAPLATSSITPDFNSIVPVTYSPPAIRTVPPPATKQASIAFCIAVVFSVLPSPIAPYFRTSNIETGTIQGFRCLVSESATKVSLCTNLVSKETPFCPCRL